MNNSIWRGRTLGILSFIFVLLLPVAGWVPLLLLWCVHLSFLIKETTNKASRKIYSVFLVLAVLLIILNLIMRIFSLEYVVQL